MPKRKYAKNGKTNMQSFLKLQLISISVYLIIFLIMAFISLGADININSTPYIAMVFIGISSFLSGCAAGIKERKNGLICGVINALPANSLLSVISLILNGFNADLIMLINVLIGLVASAAGGIVAVNIRIK